MSLYNYNPISSDKQRCEIRLVTIYPGQETIACSLAPVSLLDAPPYEALSYVWGSASITSEIYLDSIPFTVTANLAMALHHLRSDRPRVLWIDAICIDQNNEDEKSSQVLLMRRVYETAAETVIWLGEATPKSISAFELMQTTTLEDHFRDDVTKDGSLRGSGVSELLSKFTKKSSRKGLTALVDDVLERPWFTRVWVVQEVAVSKNVVVHCGSDSMPWGPFSKILYVVICLSSELSLVKSERDGHYAFLVQSRICNMVKSGEIVPFQILVATGRFLKATDPRDSVYAFYGLATDIAEDEDYLKPDYKSATLVDVYRNLVEHSIRARNSLDPICIRRKYVQPEKSSWPSWVPDWGNSPSTVTDRFSELLEGSSLNNTDRTDIYGQVAGPCPRPFAANDGISAAASIGETAAILHATGTCVDIVQDLGEPFLLGSPNYDLCDFSSWNTAVLRNLGDCRMPNGGTLFDVSQACQEAYKQSSNGYSRTFKSITALQKSFSNMNIGRSSNNIAKLQKSYPNKGNDYVAGGTIVEAYTRTLFLDDILGYGRDSAEGWEVFRTKSWRKEDLQTLAIPGNVLNRHLIISTSGYIGLGPLTMKKGDLICVLFGCEFPVLLRKVEDFYVLVGECYIQGLMYGQAIELLRQGRLETQEFVIH